MGAHQYLKWSWAKLGTRGERDEPINCTIKSTGWGKMATEQNLVRDRWGKASSISGVPVLHQEGQNSLKWKPVSARDWRHKKSKRGGIWETTQRMLSYNRAHWDWRFLFNPSRATADEALCYKTLPRFMSKRHTLLRTCMHRTHAPLLPVSSLRAFKAVKLRAIFIPSCAGCMTQPSVRVIFAASPVWDKLQRFSLGIQNISKLPFIKPMGVTKVINNWLKYSRFTFEKYYWLNQSRFKDFF